MSDDIKVKDLEETFEAGESADENGELDLSETETLFEESSELEAFAPPEDEFSSEGFLPDADEGLLREDTPVVAADVSGSELDAFESVNIEETEFIEDERLESIVESILFASDRPVSLASIKLIFKGTNITTQKIKRVLDNLMVEYAGVRRGVSLEEVPGGYQLRTKMDNMEFLRRSIKGRPFKLSGPALEVLAIAAYKQPVTKAEIDEIRGVESGHLLRALMERNLMMFQGKSDLPGKPMLYGTTKKFLEIFSLRNLKELPTLSQIDELLPEGIGEEEINKPKLGDVTEAMSQQIGLTYSEGEEELTKITDQLEKITSTTDFFEQEKVRQKQEKEKEKAQNIREALAVGETVPTRDINWLKKYDEALAAGEAKPVVGDASNEASEGVVEEVATISSDESAELEAAFNSFDDDSDVETASDDSLYDEDRELANDIADIEGEDESGNEPNESLA